MTEEPQGQNLLIPNKLYYFKHGALCQCQQQTIYNKYEYVLYTKKLKYVQNQYVKKYQFFKVLSVCAMPSNSFLFGS